MVSKRLREKLSFEINVVEHCNLNCKGCDHFSPLAKEIFTIPEAYERDVGRLAELFDDKVHQIVLLGGEPLLHPRIVDFITGTRRHFPEVHLQISTNGMLLPHQGEKFWQACHECKVSVYITNYPITLDKERIRTLAAKYAVNVGVPGDQNKEMSKHTLDPQGGCRIDRSFKKCYRGNSCIFLQGGRLFTCTVAPTAHHLSDHFGLDMAVTDEDSIDIYKAASAGEILEKLRHPIPFCRFCDLSMNVRHIKWERSKKEMSEWLATPEELKKHNRWRNLFRLFTGGL